MTSRTEHSTTAQLLGRAGMACWGVVHLVVAYLAVQVALGGGGREADQSGALQQIGANAFGRVLLWVLAAGLVAFGLWQFLMAAAGYEWVAGGKRTRKRLGAVGRGIAVLALGYSAIRLATGSGGGRGSQREQELTAQVLALPAGPVIVVAVAVAVAIVAVAAGVKGVKETFLQDLDVRELHGRPRRWVGWLGTAGYLAKAVVFALVAVLLAYSALRQDARKAGGLDSALKTLAAQPFGTALLVIVALGLAAFGVYCFAAAWAHKR
jgi:hypothetical protein